MSGVNNPSKYDEFLTQMLVNEKSILGFLSAIFNFLARRTDFYYIPQDPNENMGFPPGVAEELVVKVLRACNPNWTPPNGAKKSEDINNEIMCSTVAQEVEVVDEDNAETEDVLNINSEHDYCAETPQKNADVGSVEHNYYANESSSAEEVSSSANVYTKEIEEKLTGVAQPTSSQREHVIDERPPIIPTQKNSETYNGAERENYSWAQTILDLDVTLKLPSNIKSAKDLKVTINAGDISVLCCNGEILLKDNLAFKIKPLDSFWSISEGKLLIHLEKVQERWWTKLLSNEEAIDLSKIDCSRPMDELPEDHVAKIRELQWNQEQKLKGLPTTDQLRNIDILKKAWNAKGSPFQGKEFDPNIFLNNQ